jgi:hypothetical protein
MEFQGHNSLILNLRPRLGQNKGTNKHYQTLSKGYIYKSMGEIFKQDLGSGSFPKVLIFNSGF